jgi:adenosylcobinamide-GDP ribazoletransferase
VGIPAVARDGGAHAIPGRIGAEVRAAFALLTRAPLDPVRVGGTDASGASVFGLVGALVGLAGAVPMLALGASEPVLAGIAAVALMAAVSGALHLDGLADTADALLAADRDRAESARKDPAIGSGGAVALALVLAGQVAALSSLAVAGPGLAAAGCIAAGATSRAAPVVLARLARDRATGRGFGAWFAARVGLVDLALAVATAAGVVAAAAAIVGVPAPAVGAAAGAVAGVVAGRWIVSRRGQLDGDTLGATVELTLLATLAACAIATP